MYTSGRTTGSTLSLLLALCCLAMGAACGSAAPSEASQQPHLLTRSATLEDYESPLVTELSPPGYSIVSGRVALSAAATDDVGVTRMELYAGGVLVATSDSGSVSHDWDTTTQPDGWTWVYTLASDAAGNTSYRDAQLLVRNQPGDYEPPSVQLTLPQGPVSGMVHVSASATDNVAIARIELYVPGHQASADSDSVSVELDTTSLADEDYYVYAVAYDTSGNSAFVGGVLSVRHSP